MSRDLENNVSIMTFDFVGGRHARARIMIEGVDVLTMLNVGQAFVPLPHWDVAEPIRALDALGLQVDRVRLEYLAIASCSCGCTVCGSVGCDVTLGSGEMVWENFRTSAPARYPEVGPFRFDFEQVLSALKATHEALDGELRNPGVKNDA
jgi:hypothetical protein